MSRVGGLQQKTSAMFKRLDEATEDWQSLTDLATIIEDEYGRAYERAKRIVAEWALIRGITISRVKAGRTYFYNRYPKKAPDVTVLVAQYWGKLPAGFRRAHDFSHVPEDDRLHAILLAYGYYVHGRRDCRTAFNKWAQAHRQWKIQKEL